MAEGLRPHYQKFEYRTVQYFDKKRHVIVKKIQYMCIDFVGVFVMKNMTVTYRHLNPKTKSLERNKKKYGNRGWLLFLFF